MMVICDGDGDDGDEVDRDDDDDNIYVEVHAGYRNQLCQWK